MKLFTIGFTKKNAEEFFSRLMKAEIKTLVDIRLNNRSQLAGFAKEQDLKYFLKTIAGIDYIYRPEWAPTQEMLDSYKKYKNSWQVYETAFNKLITERKIERFADARTLDRACLLCSEDTPEHCHRRLVAEHLKNKFDGIEICHL